jgi:hypothetical protein
MRATELTGTEHGSQFVLVFDLGDEVVERLTAWCNERRITAARLTRHRRLLDGDGRVVRLGSTTVS